MILTTEQAKKSCRLGQKKKCCIYLMMTANGWSCVKDNLFLKSQMTKKLMAGKSVAKGIGDWLECLYNFRQNEKKGKI